MSLLKLEILKFGGTSVGQVKGIQNIHKILIKDYNISLPKLIIVSAACHSTNMLEKLYISIINLNDKDFSFILKSYIEKEQILNDELNIKMDLDKYFRDIKESKSKYINGIYNDNDELKDYILSFGEIISMNRLYLYLIKNNTYNLKIQKYKSYEIGFITDSNFGNARLLENSYKLIKDKYTSIYSKTQSDIIITTGFIGCTVDYKITTLGRGGSDLSATLFAKALNPTNVQIWSDVPGVMTSDPRYIQNTRLIEHITYNEALELSFFGAKILHPETIEPILESYVPLYILNTFDLNCKGTIINNSSKKDENIIKGISFNDKNSIIYISPKTSFISNNFICNIFLILNSLNINCSMISFSKTSLSICIKTHFKSKKLLDRLSFNNTNDINCIDNIGVVCVVGQSLYEHKGIASKIFSLVADTQTNIEMISQSVSQTNILFAIKEYKLLNVVQTIHDIIS